MSTAALILAGGASTRMRGVDKLLMDVDGEPQLRRVARRALALDVPVTVALRPGHPERAAALTGLDVETVVVPTAQKGMGETISGGVRHLSGHERVLLMLADIPDLDTAHMKAVIDAAARGRAGIWRGAAEDGSPGHPILIPKEFFARFSKLAGDDGGRSALKGAAVHTVRIGPAARGDLDTPEAWTTWRAARRGA